MSNLYKELETIITIFRGMPKPEIGDWDWHGMADRLEEEMNEQRLTLQAAKQFIEELRVPQDVLQAAFQVSRGGRVIKLLADELRTEE